MTHRTVIALVIFYSKEYFTCLLPVSFARKFASIAIGQNGLRFEICIAFVSTCFVNLLSFIIHFPRANTLLPHFVEVPYHHEEFHYDIFYSTVLFEKVLNLI